jgi:hypothetical protein
MRYVLLVLAMSATLTGCGGDDTAASTTGGSGTGVDSTAPKGAVSLEVYKTETQNCPYASLFIEIGNVKASPPVLVDGQMDDATVSCSVVPSGMDFTASGSLEQGANDFGFSGVVTDGASALGAVSFLDPANGVEFTSDNPCVFQFAPGTEQGISAGQLFVQFDCPDLVSSADPAVSCSSRYGYVLLDNCEGKPTM